MFQLVLNDEEQRVLSEILESELADLRVEVSETGSYEYKKMLKHREEIIKKILGILHQAQGETRFA